MFFKGFAIAEGDKVYSTAYGGYGTVHGVSSQDSSIIVSFGKGVMHRYKLSTGQDKTGRSDSIHWHDPLILEPDKDLSKWNKRRQRLEIINTYIDEKL